MSVELTIKLCGPSPKMPAFEELLMPGMQYGIMDENYRLDFGKTGEYTVVFFPDMLHRGFEFHMNKNSVDIRQPFPTSKREIRRFYEYAGFLCEKLGAEDFLRETEKASFDKVEEYIADDEFACSCALGLWAKSKSDSQYIFGVRNPIALNAEMLADTCKDLDKFGDMLHRLQSMDVFYTAPHIFRRDSGTIYGVYVLSAGLNCVVPLKPGIIMDNTTRVDEWYAAVYNGDKNSSPAIFEFGEFAENVDKSHKYDAQHFMLTLTAADYERLNKECRVYEL